MRYIHIILIALFAYSCNQGISTTAYKKSHYLFDPSDKIKVWQEDNIIDETTAIRYKEGQLTTKAQQKIWKRLAIEESTDFIVLSYLHGYKVCGGMWTNSSVKQSDKALERKLKKYPKHEKRNMHSGNAEIQRYKQSGEYIHDKDDYVNKQLFGGHKNCSSYAVIRKNGEYMRYLGELEFEDLHLYTAALYEE